MAAGKGWTGKEEEEDNRKTIYYRSGLTKKVSAKEARIISRRILEGAKTFQIFSDGDEPVKMINLMYIEHIE